MLATFLPRPEAPPAPDAALCVSPDIPLLGGVRAIYGLGWADADGEGNLSPEQTLSDEQVREVLALTSGADSVELKLTMPQADRAANAQALDVDPLDGQIRQVFFFDTHDLNWTPRAWSSAPGAARAARTTRW